MFSENIWLVFFALFANWTKVRLLSAACYDRVIVES
jgi:hypothetical protein